MEGNMGENNNFENHFIGKSALSKTLRNELIPIGHTKEMIEKYGIISQDEARTEQYKKAKEIIDDYHRYYIEKSLMNFKSDWNEFFDVMEAVRKSDDDSLKKKFAEIQSLKRKEITKYLRADENYKNMFNAKLITEVLPKFIVENNTYTPEEKTSKLETIKTFDKFATYFEGFHKNRENIYTDEEISTSIAYRVVNDNAKIFYDNLCAYNRIVEKCGSEIENIEKTNQNLLDGWTISQIFNANYYDFLMIQKSIEHYNDICAVINSYMNEYCQQHKDNKKQYKMKRLHKQILSITSTIFEIPEKFENDEQVYFIFNSFIDEITNQKILERITTLFENFNIYDLKKIYISGKSYASVSKQIVGDWSLIDKCLTEYYSKKLMEKMIKKK